MQYFNNKQIKQTILKFFLVAQFFSCNESATNLPEVHIGESEHFNYFIRETDSSFCPSLLDVMETHFSSMQSSLGFEWPEELKIDYYKFLDLQDYQQTTKQEYWAHTLVSMSSQTVLTPELFHQHELIHAYLQPTGLPIPLLTEGIAVVLAGDQRISTPTDLQDISFENAFFDEDNVYTLGAVWVAYLLNRWGAARFLKIYAALDYQASMQETNDVFFTILGMSAAQTWQEMLAAENSELIFEPDFLCDSTEIQMDGSNYIISSDCSTPYYTRTIHIAEDSIIDIRTESTSYWLNRCDGASSPTNIEPSFATQGNLFLLTAGTYILEPVWANTPDANLNQWSTELSATTVLDPGWISQSCEAISESIPYENGLHFNMPAIEGITYIALQLTADSVPEELSELNSRELDIQEYSGNSGIVVQICSACDTDSATCADLSFGEYRLLPENAYLRLQIAETRPEYYNLNITIY